MLETLKTAFPDISQNSDLSKSTISLFESILKHPLLQTTFLQKSSQQKTGTTVFILHYHQQQNLFQNIDIKKIFSIFFTPLNFNTLSSLFTLTHNYFSESNQKNNSFKTQKLLFFSFYVFFNQINDLLKLNRFNGFSADLIDKIWSAFLYIDKIVVHTNPNFQQDLLHSILYMGINSELSNSHALELNDPIFFSLSGFSLSKSAFTQFKELIMKYVREFGNPFFNSEKYKLMYVKQLNGDEFDFSNMNNISKISGPVLSPLFINGLIIENPKINYTQKNSKIIFKPQIQETVNFCDSSNKHFFSTRLIREIRKVGFCQRISTGYQWFKHLLLSVDLKSLDCPDFYTIPATSFLLPHINSINIVQNFHKCSILAFQSFELENPAQFFKFFLAVLTIVTKHNLKNQKSNSHENPLKHSKFMKGLLVVCYYLNAGINGLKSKPLNLISNLTQVNVTDIWRAIDLFLKLFENQIPSFLKALIYELETEILLINIWRKSDLENSPASHLFLGQGIHSPKILQRLLKILAERVFLICKELNIENNLTEKLWDFLKRLLLVGYEFGPKSVNTSFKENIHLDVLLLCLLAHVMKEEGVPVNLSQINKIYMTTVLFPSTAVVNNLAPYISFFETGHYLSLADKTMSLLKNDSEACKNDPFASKDIYVEFLNNELKSNLPTFSSHKSFSLSDSGSLKKRSEMFSQIEVPKFNKKIFRDFSNEISMPKDFNLQELEKPHFKKIEMFRNCFINESPCSFMSNFKSVDDVPTSHNSKLEMSLWKKINESSF